MCAVNVRSTPLVGFPCGFPRESSNLPRPSRTPFQGTGEVSAGAMIDGLLARDLTCAPTSRHAFILRPLPTRAGRLYSFAATTRAAALRYSAARPAVSRFDNLRCLVASGSLCMESSYRQCPDAVCCARACQLCKGCLPLWRPKCDKLQQQTTSSAADAVTSDPRCPQALYFQLNCQPRSVSWRAALQVEAGGSDGVPAAAQRAPRRHAPTGRRHPFPGPAWRYLSP